MGCIFYQGEDGDQAAFTLTLLLLHFYEHGFDQEAARRALYDLRVVGSTRIERDMEKWSVCAPFGKRRAEELVREYLLRGPAYGVPEGYVIMSVEKA